MYFSSLFIPFKNKVTRALLLSVCQLFCLWIGFRGYVLLYFNLIYWWTNTLLPVVNFLYTFNIILCPWKFAQIPVLVKSSVLNTVDNSIVISIGIILFYILIPTPFSFDRELELFFRGPGKMLATSIKTNYGWLGLQF